MRFLRPCLPSCLNLFRRNGKLCPRYFSLSASKIFLSPWYFSRRAQRFFITNFVTLVTNLLTHVTNFVIHVTNFVTNFFLKKGKNIKEKEKKERQQIKNCCLKIRICYGNKKDSLRESMIIRIFARAIIAFWCGSSNIIIAFWCGKKIFIIAFWCVINNETS